MAVYSMTGYATGTREVGSGRAEAGVRLVVDARSVNNRFLDLTFRLPDDLRLLEPHLRELAGTFLQRGKVEIRVTVASVGGAPFSAPSAESLRQLAELQNAIRTVLPDSPPMRVGDVLALAQGRADTPSADSVRAALPDLVRDVIRELRAARGREGERLRALLDERIKSLHQLVGQARPLVPQAIREQQQRFLARWNEALSGASSTLTESAVQERALAEAATFALRIDVAEELGRLEAHLAEIAGVLERGGTIGKRLDFLVQELHREANTLGSKAATLELTRISVDMKVLIEQMREQVQNIE
jgi:uncharacterized protein (TIGR00255 family)